MQNSDSEQFSSLSLSPSQLKNLVALGYEKMTPIQAQSLPLVLAGKDVIAQAKTGSGKTAAFGLGLLHHIEPRRFAIQTLILCPTRELADQVGKEIRRLAQAIPNIKLVSLVGGKPFGPQKGSLIHGAHIAVGTPGRVLDHLRKGTLKLDQLKTLVLDEADRMLDMGFADDMQDIVAKTPKSRQTLLFSATYPPEIKRISKAIQTNPVNVSVETEHQPGVIEQMFYEVKRHERNGGLLALFEHYRPISCLVFCHTKIQCHEVASFLREQRITALAIHGDLDQRERDQVLVQFSNKSCPVLVGTDVAARGLDVKNLDTVINYELPHDPEIYVHRIGRTGRAGEHGRALSLFTAAEQRRLNSIEEFTGEACICDVPESLDRDTDYKLFADMVTLQINAGRKQKIRPGDLLGAITGDAGVPGDCVGKIDIFDMHSYVAVHNSVLRKTLGYLTDGKVKGRSIKARKIR